MARMFGVPFDIEQEDKLIGGILSIRQCLWLAIPSAALIWAFVIDTGYLRGPNGDFSVDYFSITIKVIVVLIFAAAALFLAFGSIDGTKADTYVFRQIKFKYRKKIVKYNDK